MTRKDSFPLSYEVEGVVLACKHDYSPWFLSIFAIKGNEYTLEEGTKWYLQLICNVQTRLGVG